jgi:hypothetical protein
MMYGKLDTANQFISSTTEMPEPVKGFGIEGSEGEVRSEKKEFVYSSMASRTVEKRGGKGGGVCN